MSIPGVGVSIDDDATGDQNWSDPELAPNGSIQVEDEESMFARLIQSMDADGDQHHYGNVIDKEWWPADNFTSLALAAWQNWARLSQSKLRWFLKLLSTGQNPAPKDNELDCSFRSQHVPSFNALKAIIMRLPKCSTTTAQCQQKIITHDEPTIKK